MGKSKGQSKELKDAMLKIVIVPAILLISSLSAMASDGMKEGIKGILPDSSLYKSEIILEKLNLVLTFNPNTRIRKALLYADERIMEANIMLNQNLVDSAERAIIENSALISEINKNIGKVKSENTKTELVDVLKLQDDIEEYEANLDWLADEIMIKGESKWAEGVNKLIEINKKELKESIENKRLRAVIKIKAQNEFNQSKADKYIKELMIYHGLSEKRKNRALKSLDRAKAYIAQATERIEKAHEKGFNTDDLAGSLYKLEKEIVSEEIIKSEQYENEQYERGMIIAEKSRNIAVTVIAEKEERRFEKELVEATEKVVAEIKGLKGNGKQ